MGPFWVKPCRGPPLPSTTAAKEYNTHLTRVCVIWCYNDLVIKHSDWLWLGPNLTCNLIDALCSRLWLGHMFWTWCGQGCGTCDAQSMTCVWLGFSRTVRTVVLRLALFNSFVMLNSSTDRISVNVNGSVMITSALHLVGNEKKKEKNPITVT